MNHRVVFAGICWVFLLWMTGLCLAGENRILVRGPSPGAKSLPAGDVLVSDPTSVEVNPAITSLPNGDLFLASEDLVSGGINLYRSTDGGRTWESVLGFFADDIARNPSITYGEHTNGEQRVYVAFESVVAADDSRLVRVIQYDPIGGDIGFSVIDGPFSMKDTSDRVYPQITTDFVDWGDLYYVYVTYAAYELSNYPVYVSSSTDRGSSWSPPADVTGGSGDTTWATRPEIAYGSSGLFVTFVKPGWNGSSSTNQIWVTMSGNFGASFTTPVQLTTAPVNVFHPSVAVAHGVNTVIVAFSVDYGSDMDVASISSIDGGVSWGVVYLLSWTPGTSASESGVDLTVSDSMGRFHAAYFYEVIGSGTAKIMYTSAGTASPNDWHAGVQVNDGDTVSPGDGRRRPTITLNPTVGSEEETGIAWTDYRGGNPVTYFDSAGPTIFSDGFESGVTSAWSTTVP